MARTEGSPKPALSCARIHRAGGPINLSRREEGRTPPAAVAQPAPRRTSLQSQQVLQSVNAVAGSNVAPADDGAFQVELAAPGANCAEPDQKRTEPLGRGASHP